MQTRSSDENSVCPSVRLSNACIVTKRKKAMFRFLYHTKDLLVIIIIIIIIIIIVVVVVVVN